MLNAMRPGMYCRGIVSGPPGDIEYRSGIKNGNKWEFYERKTPLFCGNCMAVYRENAKSANDFGPPLVEGAFLDFRPTKINMDGHNCFMVEP